MNRRRVYQWAMPSAVFPMPGMTAGDSSQRVIPDPAEELRPRKVLSWAAPKHPEFSEEVELEALDTSSASLHAETQHGIRQMQSPGP